MKKLLYFSTLLFTLTSCEKENNAMDFQGNYQGTFRSNQHATTDAEINLSSTSFTVVKGPKTGNGTFKVNNKMQVTFTDKNVWTADFDFNIVLHGTYTYEALGDSLILTKYGENQSDKYYQYRLKRTEQ
jgi:hypothetical protein